MTSKPYSAFRNDRGRAEKNKVTDIFIAARQGSYSWPKHWQRTIARIETKIDTETNRYVYTVHVMNPEWLDACDLFVSSRAPTRDIQYHFNKLPERTAGIIDFDTVEELDQWARAVDRLDN